MHALAMLVASAGLIVVCLAVAVVSSRFGEDQPYPDEDVPEYKQDSEPPHGADIPRQR